MQWTIAVAVLVAAIAAGLYQDPPQATARTSPTAPTSAAVGIPPVHPSIAEVPAVPAPAVVEEKPLPMPPPSKAPAVAVAAPVPVKPVNRDSFRSEKLSAPPAPVSTIPLLPDAPEVTSALEGSVDLSREPEITRFEAPRIPDPLVTVSVETLRSSRRPAGKQAQYAPPTLLREAAVNIPAELRPSIQRLITIDVKLYLDRSGKVEFAELLSDGTGSNRDLASLAVFSSRHCEFSPAHLRDETLPAEVVLRYRFTPATRHD